MSRRLVLTATAAAMAALLALAVLTPLPGLGQTETTAETVTVTAAGEVEGEPDLATVSFGIREQAPEAEEAMDRLAAATDQVFDALIGIGIPERDIETTDVSLFADYDRVDGSRVFVGYVASTAIRVETRNLDEIGTIIDTGVRAGADSVRGISFERTNQNEAIQEALRKAMDLARIKAETLATRAGRQLGRALVITEGGARPPQPQSFGIAGGAAADVVARNIRISPPDQITRVRIVVTFALQ